jgi:hypothetical protein
MVQSSFARNGPELDEAGHAGQRRASRNRALKDGDCVSRKCIDFGNYSCALRDVDLRGNPLRALE